MINIFCKNTLLILLGMCFSTLNYTLYQGLQNAHNFTLSIVACLNRICPSNDMLDGRLQLDIATTALCIFYTDIKNSYYCCT